MSRVRSKKQTYLNKDERSTFSRFHPQVKVGKVWAYLPDKSTVTGLAEADDEESALEMAIAAIRKLDGVKANE